MRLKKEILNSPFFMLGVIILIGISGIVLANLVMNKEEIVEEYGEEIIIKPYTDFDWTKLKKDDLRYSYEDDNYESMFGVDVAAHQETIKWSKLRDAGIEFAYIRLGYRGALEGKLNTDLEFENNYKGAYDNEIKLGVYWYSQPISEQEAIEEAQYVLELIKDKEIDLPIAYDFEETEFGDGSISRIHDMTREERTKVAKAFCDEIIKNNHEVIIYTSKNWANTYYDWNVLGDYPIWLAQYADVPSFNRPFVMWQYTSDGYIDGIDRNVDFDILFTRKNDRN